MIKFVLMVNKQGQTRLAEYYDFLSIEERVALEAEIIRKCLSRNELQCSFMEYRGMKVVYRRYASLFFIVGVKQDGEVRTAARVRSWRGALPRPAGLRHARCRGNVTPSRASRRTPQNELGILEFIHVLVETLDKYFENVVRLPARVAVHSCVAAAATCGCLSHNSRCCVCVRVVVRVVSASWTSCLT